jgi:hypothetical protein
MRSNASIYLRRIAEIVAVSSYCPVVVDQGTVEYDIQGLALG